jgi:hypothetical protein
MAKHKAKPHLQNKSAMFSDAAGNDQARAHDREAHDRTQAAERAHESDTLVAEHDASRDRRAKGRKQSRGTDTGPRGRKRH